MRKTVHPLKRRVSLAASGVLALMTVSIVGCSTANVQQVKLPDVVPKYELSIPQIQADFLEYERSYQAKITGGDVTLGENLAEDEDVEDKIVWEEFQPDCAYEAESAGNSWFPVPEPELIEDPLVEEYCVENANSWCAPDVEQNYLAYRESEKQLAQALAMFPIFAAPVDEGMILRGMQAPRKGKRGHYGVDIIPISQEGRGTPIKAVEDGTVVVASKAGGYGYYTVLYHQNGIFSLYSHLLKKLPVKVGQTVEEGQTVGLMGKTGNARGYHLHFELIDLRETWCPLAELDTFIEKLSCGCKVDKQEVTRFQTMLFSKAVKQDPLPHLPPLAFAMKVKGRWVAGPIDSSTGQTQFTAQK